MIDSSDPALAARFLRGLALSPDGDAVRVGGESITYRDMHELALRWAATLMTELPAPLPAVGVLAGKGITSYVGLLAGLYTGAAVVPLHPDFPAVRTQRMMEAAGVSAVLADKAGLAVLTELAAAGVDLPVFAPGLPEPAAHPDGVKAVRRIQPQPQHRLARPRPVQGSDTAYILFTSGSTGRPKGVPITHANTHHYFTLMDARYGFTAADVFSQTFDLNFDCAMFDVFCAWGAGAVVQALPAAAYRAMPAFIAEHGLTVWFSTPSAIALIRRMGGLVPDSMPGLRWSLFAGEALQAADAVDWQGAASRSTVENIYGPTELTVTVSGHRWSPELSPGLCVNGLVPIGTVHEGHDHLLLTADGQVSATEGELCITGAQMTAGYLDPADDAGRFLHRDGKVWYRTGDRVRRLSNDELVYLGRLDAQVQVQGVRVELAEIEHALRACDGVQDAATVARSGEHGTELVVFYTGVPVPAVELVRQLRRTLPSAMVPRQYRHLDEFPLNPNRKVDRSRLASEAAELGRD